MKFGTAQRWWILLNYLVLVPWVSCARLDVFNESEEDFPRPSPPRHSVSFRDVTRAVNRDSYRVAASGEDNFYVQRPRRLDKTNPDFYFPDHSQEDPGLGPSAAAPIRHHPKPPGAVPAGFSYDENSANGPSKWYRIAPQCKGRYQSPILLNTSAALYVRQKRPLQLIGQTNLPQRIKLENDGHSAKFSYVWNEGDRPYIRGGPLKNKFFFEQFHFHWGSNDSVGSEHILDYQRFPMELHLVFYNSLYPSFEAARNEVDGLAVVGMFYELYEINDEPLNTWTRFLQQIIVPGSQYTIPFRDSFPLYSLIGDVEWPYFSYEGSLTTPPCLETVTWIVSVKPLLITTREIRHFRRLLSNHGPMVNNFRPIQKLYNRRVFRY